MRVIDFYDRHPISEQQVLAAVARRRGGALGTLTAEDLFDFDQAHSGGLAAVYTLARRAAITAGSRILDVGAGLGGPARFLASRRGASVVALELNAGRAAGCARLTQRVGLAVRARVVRGDATALPFAPGVFDACVSQEALLHVPDKLAVLHGCHRVLVPGGASYRALLGRARFASVEAEDLSTPSSWISSRRASSAAGASPPRADQRGRRAARVAWSPSSV